MLLVDLNVASLRLALADLVALSIGVIDVLQGVDAVLVHSVGEPLVDNGRDISVVDAVTLGLADLDDLRGAVQEDGVGIGGLGGQVGGVLVSAGDEHIVINSVDLFQTDQVAVGIQINVVGGVLQVDGVVVVLTGVNLQSLVVIVSSLAEVILGAANGDVGALLEGSDLGALDGLSGNKGLNLAGGHGEQVSVIFLNLGNVEVLAADLEGNIALAVVGLVHDMDLAALLQAVNGEVGLVLLGAVIAVSDAQIGVDLGNNGFLLVVVHEDLSQNAGVGAGQIVLVVLSNIGQDGLGSIVAVDISSHVILVHGGLADLVVDFLAGNTVGVLSNHQAVVHIGADVGVLVGPLVSGTAEIVSSGLLLQVGEVLLGELHLVVVLDGLGTGIVLHVLRDLVGLNSAVGDHDGLVGVLNHGGVQGVESVQAGFLTVDSLDTVELALQAVIQADGDGLLGNVDGPVGAGVALVGSVIAQSAQQHLHESIASQRVGGLEGAVSITGDDAGLLAVSDVASEGMVGSNVLVGSGVSHQSGCGGGAKDQVADDLGSSATGQGVAGIEGTVGIAVDDLCLGQHVNSFSVVDLAAVREVLGTSADGDQRHGHHQSQYQRKELLHGISSF